MRARVLSVSRCSSVTCGVGGGGAGSAAGRGEETHGDAVARPPKSGIARKATEAVGARGLARFGDAETCARSPLSAAGELSEHCPRGGGATRKRGDSTLEHRTHLGAYRGFAVGGRRVSRVRGAGANIGRGGGARVRTGPGGRLRLFGRQEVSKGRREEFFCHVFLDGNGNCEPCRREQRGFRLTEKIIGHVQNVIKPDCGLVRLSQTNLRFTAGADAAAFSFITRARLSPVTPTRAGHPAETRSSASSSKERHGRGERRGRLRTRDVPRPQEHLHQLAQRRLSPAHPFAAVAMGKCGQTMNAKRKHKNKQRKENSRALKLRKNGVLKNRAELARVSGVARTGKQARKQLRNARRRERNDMDDAAKEAAAAEGGGGADGGGDVVMAD